MAWAVGAEFEREDMVERGAVRGNRAVVVDRVAIEQRRRT
jgi:hypothetical protein